MTGARRNIELKARCADLSRAARAAEQLGAGRQGLLEQLDTYFHCRQGRLKLRETAGDAEAQLIWYARPDSTDFRGSDYYVLPIPKPLETRLALSAALGVRGKVSKRRELWLWHNVRIHLDEVAALGTFVEFEAVVEPGESEEQSLDRLATLTRALNIGEVDRIAVSYSDLLGI
jgi:adenylate cyclase, class 2